MTCVCGYEYEYEYQPTPDGPKKYEKVILKGKEDFIRIQGNFTIENEYHYGVTQISLFACPICSTIKMVE